MANFRKGAQALQEAAEKTGGGKWVPEIRWDGNETKYIQFLDSMDEVNVVLMHTFVTVAYREADGKPVFRSFISRRDPSLDGPEGYDELMDRFGCKPKQRGITKAIELEPLTETVNGKKKIVGFEPKYRAYTNSKNEEVEVPAIGLVIQAPGIFFGQLAPHAEIEPIEDAVFQVKRIGKDLNTQYSFIKVGEAINIEDDEEVVAFLDDFDFDAYLDDLSSEDRMRELIAPLPDDFVVDQFAKKGQQGSSRPSGGTTRSRRPAATEPEEDAPVTTRARRFSDLKEELENG